MLYYFDIYELRDSYYYFSRNSRNEIEPVLNINPDCSPQRRGSRGEFIIKVGDYIRWTPKTLNVRIE